MPRDEWTATATATATAGPCTLHSTTLYSAPAEGKDMGSEATHRTEAVSVPASDAAAVENLLTYPTCQGPRLKIRRESTRTINLP